MVDIVVFLAKANNHVTGMICYNYEIVKDCVLVWYGEALILKVVMSFFIITRYRYSLIKESVPFPFNLNRQDLVFEKKNGWTVSQLFHYLFAIDSLPDRQAFYPDK